MEQASTLPVGEGAASTAVTGTEMDERSCAREQDRISRRLRQLTRGLLVFLQHLERRKQHPVYSRVHVTPTVKGLQRARGAHASQTPGASGRGWEQGCTLGKTTYLRADSISVCSVILQSSVFGIVFKRYQYRYFA